MVIPIEFYVPHNALDLDDPLKRSEGQYFIETVCVFDVPLQQQVDDLTRLFALLHHEKSPTAIFTKSEYFISLYGYVKGIITQNSEEVNKLARHKICHEIAEKMKKLLQVCIIYLRKRDNANSTEDALPICLRSTLKMYCFIISTILSSTVPKNDDKYDESTQKNSLKRKRKRTVDSGFGEDNSGVDLDGRELALNSLIEMVSNEIAMLWPCGTIESTTLSLIFRMCLHMVTQKANISSEAQCISSALSLLLARILILMSSRNSIEVTDLTFPLVDVALKSESAVIFLCKLVSDIESDESSSDVCGNILSSIFESMCSAAIHEAPNDASAAKNISTFFSEVAKRSVSITQKFSNQIRSTIHSESYDIRKGVITAISELLIQKYSLAHQGIADDSERAKFYYEVLFRVMDVNLFVRNHTLHTLGKLIDSKAIPKSFYLLTTELVTGRLEDKSFLVRGGALSCVSNLLQKMWFGQVLNSTMVQKKYNESVALAEPYFTAEFSFRDAIDIYKAQRAVQIGSETILDGKEELPNTSFCFSPEQAAVLAKVYFFDCAIKFIGLMKKAMHHATLLLDSKTERDVNESIQLVVGAASCRLDGCDRACLKMIVLAFHNEIRIQYAVRDAFAEIVFGCFFTKTNVPHQARVIASAQKLIQLLRGAREGEISAVERIFLLFKSSPNLSRYISTQFVDAIWNIVDGSFDGVVFSLEDRRTAIRIFSILSRFAARNVSDRRERILEFLNSDLYKDNMLITYVLKTLENEAAEMHQFSPIPISSDPLDTPVLSAILGHLCRRTNALPSWMCLANAGVNAIHSLCEVPVLVYTYILQYLQNCISRDETTKAQLCFLIGCTALKQLIAIETAEKMQIKVLEESGPCDMQFSTEDDKMQKDLGLSSIEFHRHAIQQLAQKRRMAILEKASLWAELSESVVIPSVIETSSENEKLQRVCAVVALCQLMIVSEKFCAEKLPLLFEILSKRSEFWVVKTNVVIALGDLACVYPNVLSPFLNSPNSGLFKLLKDDDLRVRAVTIQVCSHLVLSEMLRIKDHLFTIVKLVADSDKAIADNAITFIQNLAVKEKERTGNLIPPLVTKLSGMPQDKFRIAMKTLLERVEGDKPTESLIDRICQRFESFQEKSKKKLVLAENLAFCLSELNILSERPLKKLMSEPCYQQYRLWLRKSSVLEYFKLIISKAKKNFRGGSGNRDLSALEEWETRITMDSTAIL